jgi:hypothetical protein
MAVVFISPKQRQNMFFTGITVVVGLFLIVVASVVFFSQPKEVAQELVFNKPKVSINFEVLDSEQFKDLQSFSGMQMQFTYKATTKDGKDKEGYISAESIEKAEAMLTELGYTVTQIKEAATGRDNPFVDYKLVTSDELQKLLQGTQTEE